MPRHLLVTVVAMAVVALASIGSSSHAAPTEASHAKSLQSSASSPDTSLQSTLSPEEPAEMLMCNPTGYLRCQSSDGTACYAPGTSARCIVEPEYYCEWGRCLCNSTYTWQCFW